MNTEREKLRRKTSAEVWSAEQARLWNEYGFKVAQLDRQISEAKISLAEAQCADSTAQVIENNFN